jgi:hypothetical protein
MQVTSAAKTYPTHKQSSPCQLVLVPMVPQQGPFVPWFLVLLRDYVKLAPVRYDGDHYADDEGDLKPRSLFVAMHGVEAPTDSQRGCCL